MLTPRQRVRLLRIAREAIEAALQGRIADPRTVPDDPDLMRPSGAFVSLHTREGELRGCIGSIEAIAPLSTAVASNAVAAALRDPRFVPLEPSELDEVHIEISVMSPIEQVGDVATIEVGRDGLIVRQGGRAGLLLPQVATSFGWDRETFLAQTCRKAGLSSDAWRSPSVQIERFSAEVFGE